MNPAGSYQVGSFYDDELFLLFTGKPVIGRFPSIAENSVQVKFSLPNEKDEGSLGWSSTILRDDVLPYA